jgi:hypothetical protein
MEDTEVSAKNSMQASLSSMPLGGEWAKFRGFAARQLQNPENLGRMI